MTISPAVIVRPRLSCTISKSGGRSQPVSPGDIRRDNHPDGAIRKASPKAAAACGTDKSGESNRSSARNGRVPDQPAVTSATISKETDVASSPVKSESITARGSPPQAKRSRSGSNDGPVRPAAGKCPNAGRNVPHSPATTGPNITTNVRIGKTGRKRRRFIKVPVSGRGYMVPRLFGHTITLHPVVGDTGHPAWVWLCLNGTQFGR